ncbi:fused isobutyryl-CoA mutase/GTPase IcmF [Bradymonas sediminis]|uniref:Fused isobutyryl-CoA mutase n=1 Tax=Bradymonas sediminis TaxID=1548548 RepID=A0A2Z4FN11_9DELT|nr:fused isobutyryl-CoA mutase/GTPase IcmF [Bradymonas sediminis]AWV90367.1 methylmalonyl-CoA mutase [Bradymonas sediminis]TDP72249.1 methylmalonyl-CoA mutase [Bradymonas sediminis]
MSGSYKKAGQIASEPIALKNHVRFVTAASLFDGHDAAINVMRRIIQDSGAEVIHLGHNRSVVDIVEAAIQEDAQGIAISSYQGGHIEFFKYMHDLLEERGAGHIQIFAGGGGVIVPEEIKELEDYGIVKIFSPDDGRSMGLQGMINFMLEKTDYDVTEQGSTPSAELIAQKNTLAISRAISFAEHAKFDALALPKPTNPAPVVGITGTGGAGKSSLTDEFVRRYVHDFEDKTVAIISIDPTRRRSGGALLGDRIRMNSLTPERTFMRSMATRQSKGELAAAIDEAVHIAQCAGFDLIVVETSGIGQGDADIVDHCDHSIYVMTSEFGASSQLEKIDMLDLSDFVVINKYEKAGSLDSLRAVRKQVRRNRKLWDAEDDDLPVFATIASQFGDSGVTALYQAVIKKAFGEVPPSKWKADGPVTQKQNEIIPPARERYLAELAETCRDYRAQVEAQAELASRLYRIEGARAELADADADDLTQALEARHTAIEADLTRETQKLLEGWEDLKAAYDGDETIIEIRGKGVPFELVTESLSGTKIRKVALPKYRDWGDQIRWQMLENVPGRFPYTAGVFPFKRVDEHPARMFAGEGTPERTNQRFHYLSQGEKAKRLSTAFDSVTLYGEDPALRPDIYGKIGNSGVSICSLDDMKKLYAGFDLADPYTSVSMTINGPAPIILAMFLNTAIDQQVEAYRTENGHVPEGEAYEKLYDDTLRAVRGTVQADILKEDQAQNTCIFSTDFALKMMGDIQAYFIDKKVRNYYSVSISGYHIAEAGANPITQLAFTLANGFTYVEYYLSRGMHIDDFAPNLSFFFSNGMDPEYTVLGRVARRIWSVVMREKYGANARSQRLKYHIQTSGRSLHAQEVQFNDIRTTLQALLALFDNCNSLHTNAYDEAITTPTEASVRRALAIQLIINKEFGLAKNENPNQGSFIVEELTDLVEEAVLQEFENISNRGGVLGAMERQYQRSQIQEESIYYERKKHSGALPIIGVNTFLSDADEDEHDLELIRSTEAEKKAQIANLAAFQQARADQAEAALERLKQAALNHGNIFAELMHTVRYASLGQITHALYEVGGQYRRAM